MKLCNYCGRENDDEAARCRECGSNEFEPPASPASTGTVGPSRFDFKPLNPAEAENDLVTLLTCRTLLDADMILGLLEGAQIEGIVPDQFLMQAVSFNLNTYGYVRVQVAPKDYDEAKALLLAAERQS